jgi:anaerobic dimethyl sulfoxide reductase subunit A
VDRAVRVAGPPEDEELPFHLITPHPRWRTHSIFHNIPWLRETYQQEVTINASDAPARHQDRRHRRGLERSRQGAWCRPTSPSAACRASAVLHEGAWMDLDKNGVDRAGNPDFLTLDEPSPAGAFAYNTVLVNMKQDDTRASPGWDRLATSRSTFSAGMY